MCSRRRLVFTEEQAYFECKKMSCSEAVDFEWDLEAYNVFQKIPLGGFPWSILTHISEYSGRQSTYPEDSLNALLGVFRFYRKRKNPVHHFWGVPIIPTKFKRHGNVVIGHSFKRHGDVEETCKTLSEGFVASL